MISTLRRQLAPALRASVARSQARCISQALAEPMAWNQPAAQMTKLPNGVRVVTTETYGEVASVGLFIDAGVRDETVNTVGAATMIEKLALTGTSKRPKATLESEVESMGAELSVEIGRERTEMVMSLMGSDVGKGVEILGDIASNPGISNYAKEKEAIIRGLEELEKPTKAVIADRLHSCAFRDYSLGFSTIGPFEGIGDLSEQALSSYVSNNYTADKMVIAASGPVNHAELVKAAEASFGGFKAGTPAPGATKPYFCGAELLYRNDEMGPTAYISVGWEGVPLRSPDAVTFMVMQHVIGSYKKNAGVVPGTISGNRVSNAIANKMGVGCADEYQAFNYFYKDTGMFGFYVACDEVAVEHAVGELMFGANLLSFSVTDEEVARGRRELKLALYGGSGTAIDACKDLGDSVLSYGRKISPAEMMLRIDAVDAEEVKRVAWQYLNDNEISVTALGPLHGMIQFVELRRMTVMHRY